MIEKITTNCLGREVEMVLVNDIAKSIYKIDSVNLLLGANGTGKTKILKDLVNSIYADGSGEYGRSRFVMSEIRTGVLYYTPVPFHKALPSRKNPILYFKDISIIDKDFWDVITKEKLIEAKEVFDIFGIPPNIVGRLSFDVNDFVFTKMLKVAECYERLHPECEAGRVDIGYSPEIVSDFESLFHFVREHILAKDSFAKLQRECSDLAIKLSQMKQSGERGAIVYSELAADLRSKNEELTHADAVIFESESKAHRLIGKFVTRSLDQFLLSGDKSGCNFLDLNTVLTLFVHKNISVESTLSILLGCGEKHSYFKRVKAFLGKMTSLDLVEVDVRGSKLNVGFNILKPGLDLNDGELLYFAKRGLVKLGLDNLSSGQRAVVQQCLLLKREVKAMREASVERILVLIDEGDMLLHLQWQRTYIEDICKVLAAEAGDCTVQLIIATHSAMLTTDVFRSAITCLDENVKRVIGFGASMPDVMFTDFDITPVGSLSEKFISELMSMNSSDLQKNAKLINYIDDEVVKYFFEQEL